MDSHIRGGFVSLQPPVPGAGQSIPGSGSPQPSAGPRELLVAFIAGAESACLITGAAGDREAFKGV